MSYKNLLALTRYIHGLCELHSLREFKPLPIKENEDNVCQRVDPLPGSCDLANSLFFSQPVASCAHQKKYDFCKLENERNEWFVTCNEKASQACESSFYLGVVSNSTGSVKWQEVGSAQQVAAKLTTYLKHFHDATSPTFYGFCFIRCKLKSSSEVELPFLGDGLNNEGETYGEQLLVLPPQLSSRNQASGSSSLVNINIILVDSVSHQHFFRSLKETVAALENINSDLDPEGHVLDFRLFQAVRSRTFESLQVLFSGQIDPMTKPFGTQALPPERLNLSALLSKFKRKGYKTLWLEDLCYLWEWGMAKDLLFLNKSSSDEDTWLRMWKTLKECEVDSVDITLSMCKVLKANNVVDHFHGPDAVCFNGRHQHEYLLEYLLFYQQQMEKHRQPFFTFTMSNVGHEDSGRRIQTLDSALASYLIESLRLKSTLTIILSDHGNSYGDFFKESQEAHIELFHPFMFFIIPKNVANILGSNVLNNLYVNTNRLISLLDLHYTLNHIVDSSLQVPETHRNYLVSHRGLFDPVDSSRTCNNIPRILPNFCICRNFDMPVRNDSEYSLFAYFAVGQLNNELQRQVSKQSSSKEQKAFKKCQRLVLQDVRNIKKSYGVLGTEVVKMDLHVQEGHIFFVAVSVKHQEDQRTLAVLEKYDRITPYGIFSACADDGVDLSLCICDMPTQQAAMDSSVKERPDFSDMHLLPNFEVQTQMLKSEDNCVMLLTVKHEKGAVIFVANSCSNKSFQLKMKMEAEEDVVYSPPPVNYIILHSEGMVNIGLIYVSTYKEWTFSMRIQCILL
ncbi:hypothetical protein Btru_016147 [Bulinus truncatus]|nr:hypothetical protein Btru_016147 [Bulinus truncatus]